MRVTDQILRPTMVSTDQLLRATAVPATVEGRSAKCPLRPGQPCTLCHPEARKGPQDCPTVALVMDDPELRANLARFRAEHRANEKAAKSA
jgi:hypothetical protein